MTAIIRRLRKLEERFGPPVETAYTRRLRERIEEGRQRLAEAKKRGEWSGPVSDCDGENFGVLSVIEILYRGRARVATARLAAPGWQQLSNRSRTKGQAARNTGNSSKTPQTSSLLVARSGR